MLITRTRCHICCHLVYFSGTEGMHGDLFSTLAMENIAKARFFGQASPFPECQSSSHPEGCGIYQYQNMASGLQALNLIPTCQMFRGAMMRATWTKGRLWALMPSIGGEWPGIATSRVHADVGARKLHMNAATTRGGILRVGLLLCTHTLRC